MLVLDRFGGTISTPEAVLLGMQIQFQRYAGAGNDFLIVDAVNHPFSLSEEEMEPFVRRVADRRSGPGSDGLILLRPSRIADFEMRFYNPDGSFGALCGNGSRCAVQAARDFGIVQNAHVKFEVLGEAIDAEILREEWVRVQFRDPIVVKHGFKLRIGQRDFLKANYVDLGSQHVVVFTHDLSETLRLTVDIESLAIANLGPRLRWHPDLQPLGANANFAQVMSDDEGEYIRIRTWERGVEGETLACGTGCMSTAIIAYATGQITSLPTRLKTQSGEFVFVNFELENRRVRMLTLEGSAKRLESGILEHLPIS